MENNIALQDRRLPAGIQSFEEIRREGYLYVDKTDIVWALANKYFKYNYLSRPRRFGKSVLVDTLECYFLGKKELFEGLKINQLERNWIEYPVLRLDMSRGRSTAEELQRYLSKTFSVYEEKRLQSHWTCHRIRRNGKGSCGMEGGGVKVIYYGR